MATKVKPSRVQAIGTPQAGQVPVYVDEDKFEWGEAGSSLTEENAGPGIVITEEQESEQSGSLIEIEGKLKEIIAYGATEQETGTYIDSVTANGKCELSSIATPTTPINIVCNNGAIKVSPNLLNMNDIYGNYLLTDTGQVGSEAQNFVLTNFIRVLPSTTYVFSFISGTDAQYRRVCGYSSADQTTFTQLLIKKARPTTVDTQIDLTFTTGASTNYIRISTCIGDTNVQIAQGSTAPTYRPYKQIYTDGTVETVTDNAGNVANAEMLLGIFNSIDTQEILSGTVTRDIDITVLDGSEEGYTKLSTKSVFSSSLICTNITRIKSVIYCTHFVYDSGSTSEIEDGVIGTANTSTNVFMRNDDCASIDEFKQWLKDQYTAGTPVIIVYQRQTETTETVAGQVLTKSPATVTAGSISGLTITTVESPAPAPNHPLPIFCNNGELKVDNQGNVYANGTAEEIEVNSETVATAEMLLKVGDYIDEQSIIDGEVTRKIGIKVLDGTENWVYDSTYSRFSLNENIGVVNATVARSIPAFCTHYRIDASQTPIGDLPDNTGYIGSKGSEQYSRFWVHTSAYNDATNYKAFLASEYQAGHPVILVYPLQTATTETVAGQPLDAEGDLTISATGEISPLTLKVIFDTFLKISAIDEKAEWGDIEGTLSDQTDLQTALNGKVNLGANTMVDGIQSYTAYYTPEHTIHTIRDDTDTGDDLEIYPGGIAYTIVSNGIGTTETYTFGVGSDGDIVRMKDLSGSVKYEDFETSTVVGATLTISYFTTQITPSANFTLVAGTVKEGMQYIVRVNSGATAYTMSLGTGVTNPFGEDLTLTASKTTTVVLLATSSSTLEIFSIRTAE